MPAPITDQLLEPTRWGTVLVVGVVTIMVLSLWSHLGWFLRRNRHHERELSTGMLAARDAERSDLASELHGSIAPRLVHAGTLMTRSLPGAAGATRSLTDSIRSVSHRIGKLPGTASDNRLIATIDRLATESFPNRAALHVTDLPGLDPAVEAALCGVAEEAVAAIEQAGDDVLVDIVLSAVAGGVEFRISASAHDTTSAMAPLDDAAVTSMNSLMRAVGGSLDAAADSDTGRYIIVARVGMR